jgi:hypothetical protein
LKKKREKGDLIRAMSPLMAIMILRKWALEAPSEQGEKEESEGGQVKVRELIAQRGYPQREWLATALHFGIIKQNQSELL